MKLPALYILLLTLPWVWLLLIDRARTTARLGHDRLHAFSLAATLWLLALSAVDGPRPLMMLLTLPCLIVFALAAWQAARRTWVAGQVLFGRKRKVA
ncbi:MULTISPECIES: hypothetical protein [Methylobacterium]|uniref:hypothetical protein n=1 Tax=Methylobacterium TaxID=407 RepID=UPI002F34061D